MLLTLDRRAPVPLRAQVENGLRELIRAGRLAAGAPLPSSRVLAADLGVSRRLVVEAYQQLTAEGYLSARERSVTRVAQARAAAAVRAPDPSGVPRYDLEPGVPDLGAFPRAAWLKAVGRALADAPDAALGYGDPRGAGPLRVAVAGYLRRVRAVAADPERVLIFAGFRQALSLLIQVLGHPVVGLEDPGMTRIAGTVAAAGGSQVPVPVDAEGARTGLLPGSGADVMVVAPAHQYPLGVTLSPARRTQLLAWATESGGLVVEDDYDAEFRYDRQPVGSLQGLAPDHVAYGGTVSKTLAPALRLGWLVLPGALVDPLTQAKLSYDSGCPAVDQLALAHLIDSGAYERHLRRMRQQYRQRRDALVAALRQHLPEATVSGTAAGLHLVLTLPGGVSAARVTETAARRGLALSHLGRYRLSRDESHEPDDRLVVGYGKIAMSAVGDAVACLAGAVADARD